MTKKSLESRIGFCDFNCKFANMAKSTYAACLTENGPYCTKRKKCVGKGTPCISYKPRE